MIGGVVPRAENHLIQGSMRTAALALLGGMLVAGCNPGTGALPAEGAPRQTAPVLKVAPQPRDSITLCGVRQGRLVRLSGITSAVTGDTLVEGRPIGEALPPDLPPYAGRTKWYQTFQPIIVHQRRYPTEGYPPRDLLPEELEPEPVAFHNGVPVFVEAGSMASDQWGGIFYVLLSPDCRFQPYLLAI